MSQEKSDFLDSEEFSKLLEAIEHEAIETSIAAETYHYAKLKDAIRARFVPRENRVIGYTVVHRVGEEYLVCTDCGKRIQDNPDAITVTLSREEARVVANCLEYGISEMVENGRQYERAMFLMSSIKTQAEAKWPQEKE